MAWFALRCGVTWTGVKALREAKVAPMRETDDVVHQWAGLALVDRPISLPKDIAAEFCVHSHVIG